MFELSVCPQVATVDRVEPPTSSVGAGDWFGVGEGDGSEFMDWTGGGPGPLPCDEHGTDWPVFGDLPPSPEVATRLMSIGPTTLDEFDLVEAVAAWEAVAAFAQAQQVLAMAELVGRPMFARLSGLRDGIDPIRAVALEVSARLSVSVQEAQRRVSLACELVEDRPATFASLRRGEIDYWRAKTITDEVRTVAAPVARVVEEQILPEAAQLSRTALRRKIQKLVLTVDPSAAEQRHQRALADRQVRCSPEDEGMGSTWALLSATDTWVLDQVLDSAADGMKVTDPAAARTHAQRRADALAEMAWSAWHTGWIGAAETGIRLGRHGRRPEIGVLVPLSTLIGADDQPAELVGFGPIPASVARRIAAEGTWRRILTDPVTGRVLDYGRTRYRPPQDLVDHVIVRDQTCRGIACIRLAWSCDIDHTRRYPEGPTSAANTGPECRIHHNGKTHGGWTLTQPAPGQFRWRSPTGHYYTRPAERVGPIAQQERPTDDPDPPPF